MVHSVNFGDRLSPGLRLGYESRTILIKKLLVINGYRRVARVTGVLGVSGVAVRATFPCPPTSGVGPARGAARPSHPGAYLEHTSDITTTVVGAPN